MKLTKLNFHESRFLKKKKSQTCWNSFLSMKTAPLQSAVGAGVKRSCCRAFTDKVRTNRHVCETETRVSLEVKA